MKKVLLSCILLASCLALFACASQQVPSPSSSALSKNSDSSSSSSSEQASRDAWEAPSTVGYTYFWDDMLKNIYAPSEAYPMGDPQPGGEPIHIEPRVEREGNMDIIQFGGDVMGYKVACVQATAKEEWESDGFLYSTDKKDYTREELAPYLIREDEDYVLLDITELVLGSPFEEYLKQKAEENGTPEIMYSWVLEPAAHLKEHLSDILVKK